MTTWTKHGNPPATPLLAGTLSRTAIHFLTAYPIVSTHISRSTRPLRATPASG